MYSNESSGRNSVIEGFMEEVSPRQVSGWAFDRDRPSVHLVIDVYCGDRHLGSTTADIYRVDLARRRIGEGDHAFLFLIPSELEPAQVAAVTARARVGSDSTAVQDLPRHVRRAASSAARVVHIEPPSTFKDETQLPVFVLGAPRSGTSAVAQALVRGGGPYAGHNEGQVLDLLTPLLNVLRRFYAAKTEAIPSSDRATMTIARIPEEYFANGIIALFADSIRQLFSSRRWCDKTPTADMMWAAPNLLRIWPNAKFIFLKRRGLENILSRTRKFRGASFESQCSEWTACMEAWRAVRGSLAGRALELDQHFLAQYPTQSAEAIGALLALASEERENLARLLSRHQPERTGASVLDVQDASVLTWDVTQWEIFDRICGAEMNAYGYGRDKGYYAPGAEDRSCIAL
jgi:hypothetical protein